MIDTRQRQMWELHTHLKGEPFDLQERVASLEDDDVILGRYGTACYPEHGLPLMLFLAANHGFDPSAALLANANAGGDNVHRSAVLGLWLGAAATDFPDDLKTGLRAHDSLAEEIGQFAEIAASGMGF